MLAHLPKRRAAETRACTTERILRIRIHDFHNSAPAGRQRGHHPCAHHPEGIPQPVVPFAAQPFLHRPGSVRRIPLQDAPAAPPPPGRRRHHGPGRRTRVPIVGVAHRSRNPLIRRGRHDDVQMFAPQPAPRRAIQPDIVEQSRRRARPAVAAPELLAPNTLDAVRDLPAHPDGRTVVAAHALHDRIGRCDKLFRPHVSQHAQTCNKAHDQFAHINADCVAAPVCRPRKAKMFVCVAARHPRQLKPVGRQQRRLHLRLHQLAPSPLRGHVAGLGAPHHAHTTTAHERPRAPNGPCVAQVGLRLVDAQPVVAVADRAHGARPTPLQRDAPGVQPDRHHDGVEQNFGPVGAQNAPHERPHVDVELVAQPVRAVERPRHLAE